MSALLKKTIWLFLFFGWQLLPAQHPFFLSHTLGEEFKETKISVVHEQRSGLLGRLVIGIVRRAAVVRR